MGTPLAFTTATGRPMSGKLVRSASPGVTFTPPCIQAAAGHRPTASAVTVSRTISHFLCIISLPPRMQGVLSALELFSLGIAPQVKKLFGASGP